MRIDMFTQLTNLLLLFFDFNVLFYVTLDIRIVSCVHCMFFIYLYIYAHIHFEHDTDRATMLLLTSVICSNRERCITAKMTTFF